MKKFYFLLFVLSLIKYDATAQKQQNTVGATNSSQGNDSTGKTSSVPLLSSATQSAKMITNSFFWDGNLWEKIQGAVTNATSGYLAMALPGPAGYCYKRSYSGDVNAKWFGAKGDGTTDNTASLQKFIDYIASTGSSGYIPKGLYKITSTLNVGSDTKQASSNSSFKIRGESASIGDGRSNNGTRILYSGTTAKAILRVKKTAWYFVGYEDISLNSETTDGAEYGLLFETIGFTQHNLKGLRVENTKRAFGILGGGMANGEFITFERCSAANVDRFFYMDETSGQSMNHLFNHCGALIRNGGACFELGGGNLGYGIHVIDFEASGQTTRTGYTYLINNGISGEAIFDGGRIEHCATLVSQSVGTTNQNAPFSFNDIEFDGMRTSDTIPFLSSTGGSGAYQYIFKACRFNIRSVKNGFFGTKIAHTDGSFFQFVNCLFEGPNMFGYQPENDLGGMEFVNCNFFKIKQGSSSPSGSVLRLNKSSVLPSIGTLGKRSIISSSAWQSPGVPSNLLIYPDFGSTFGQNIAAPSPWVHTGQHLSFTSLQGYGSETSIAPSPAARLVTIAPSSGVYQDIAITKVLQSITSVYQAIILASGNATFKISLENPASGEEYDRFEMTVNRGVPSKPICVSLFSTDINPTGNLRLKIQNLSLENNVSLQFLSQLVSQNPMASYINPPPGKTKEFTNYWSANEDMVRVYGRLAIPHKTDVTGSAAAALPDVESDVYLSKNTERIKYYAKGKWWDIPRTTYGISRPESLSWDQGDIVYNSQASSAGPVAWICTQGGTPGNWQPISKTTDHIILAPSESSPVSLINNQYNIINPHAPLRFMTLKLPDNPQDNDEITIKFVKTADNIKLTNGHLACDLSKIAPGNMVKLIYDTITLTWY